MLRLLNSFSFVACHLLVLRLLMSLYLSNKLFFIIIIKLLIGLLTTWEQLLTPVSSPSLSFVSILEQVSLAIRSWYSILIRVSIFMINFKIRLQIIRLTCINIFINFVDLSEGLRLDCLEWAIGISSYLARNLGELRWQVFLIMEILAFLIFLFINLSLILLRQFIFLRLCLLIRD